MASSTEEGSLYDGDIRLWQEAGWWIAKDVETGVTTQGESREAALANLDEAVALHNWEIGREPTEEELRELGIDPADNTTVTSSRRTFFGNEAVKVLVNVGGLEWRRTTGDHAQLYYEHPTNEDDRRQVTVHLHDELKTGALREITDRAGANDFDSFCDWIHRNA